jgi:hypothetical protein
METCPKCGSLLRTSDSYYSTENDDTPNLETIVYVNIKMVCPNTACEDYAGNDLTNPRIVVDTVKNRVN